MFKNYLRKYMLPVIAATVVFSGTALSVESSNKDEVVTTNKDVDFSKLISFNLTPDETETETDYVKKVSTEFSNFYKNYDSWCSDSDTMSIDVIHDITSDGTTVNFIETYTQISNVTNTAHTVSYKPNHVTDIWYDLSEENCYVSLSTDSGTSNWVDTKEVFSTDIKDFISNQITYNKSLCTVKDVLNFINSFVVLNSTGSLEVEEYPDMNGYSVKFSSNDDIELNAAPTFCNPANLSDWSVYLSKLDNYVYIVVKYNYKEGSSVQSESYKYSIKIDEKINVDMPMVLQTNAGTSEQLEELYKEIKGE